VLVALDRQSRVLATVSRQGRSPEAAKPTELLAPAERCKCFDSDRLYPVNSHSRSMLLGSRLRASSPSHSWPHVACAGQLP
jgi:hypothetical protein